MRGTSILLALILLVIGGFGLGIPIVKAIKFNVGCEGFLKSAADAPTLELAIPELDTAIAYMEKHDLTEGYSCLIIENRQADVGYWYNRIRDARTELDKIPDNATVLEKSNMLMKLRETLLDTNEHGTAVTVPPHISTFPNQWFWTIAILIALVCIVIGIMALIVGISDF